MNRGKEIHARIAELAAEVQAERRAEVERRILEGENVVELPYLPDAGRPNPRLERYTCPSWRREPTSRLRVEFARWRYRRSR